MEVSGLIQAPLIVLPGEDLSASFEQPAVLISEYKRKQNDTMTLIK
jgi:hypothetical protein